jgi:hypothetical protein
MNIWSHTTTVPPTWPSGTHTLSFYFSRVFNNNNKFIEYQKFWFTFWWLKRDVICSVQPKTPLTRHFTVACGSSKVWRFLFGFQPFWSKLLPSYSRSLWKLLPYNMASYPPEPGSSVTVIRKREFFRNKYDWRIVKHFWNTELLEDQQK